MTEHDFLSVWKQDTQEGASHCLSEWESKTQQIYERRVGGDGKKNRKPKMGEEAEKEAKGIKRDRGVTLKGKVKNGHTVQEGQSCPQ